MKYLIFISLYFVSVYVNAQSDNPCGAPNIPVNSACSLTTVNITNSAAYQNNPTNFGPVSCGVSGPDVWYSFTAPASGNVTIQTTAGNITDGVMALYSSNCVGTYSLIACDDDSGPGFMPQISTSGLTAGAIYYIRLWEWFGFFTGYYQVCVIDNASSPTTGNQNCTSATGICNNATFSGNSNGFGLQELNAVNSGCMSVEHQSSWYTFTIQTSGTLSMTISPVNSSDDYDFAIWGPFSSCTPVTFPARCSWSAQLGNTGLQNGAGDNTEGAGGDKWVEDIVTISGENYLMLIDNFSVSYSPFNLSWGGTASLDCAIILPVELVYFDVFNEAGINTLYWMTATELNNNYFTIERSMDGIIFETISSISGAGTSSTNQAYKFNDRGYKASINYYRLTQTDYDGNSETFNIISIDNTDLSAPKIIKIVNIMGQEVGYEYTGLKCIIYENGEVVKRIDQ